MAKQFRCRRDVDPQSQQPNTNDPNRLNNSASSTPQPMPGEQFGVPQSQNYSSSLGGFTPISQASQSSSANEPVMPAGSISRRKLASYVRLGPIAVILIILLILGAFASLYFLLGTNEDEDQSRTPAAIAKDFEVAQISLTGLIKDGQISIDSTQQLSVNGQLRANNSFVIAPTTEPQNPTKGQIYYNQGTNELFYFDGTAFVSLVTSQSISSLGLGSFSSINEAGDGLAIQGQTLTNTGVLSVQGQSGAITLTSGGGIGISGLTISNTGVTGISGTANQISVSAASGNVTLSLPQNISPSSSPTFAGLNLSAPLSVGSGGTGVAAFAANSVIVSNGSGGLTTTGSGLAGECLRSNGGGVTPSFQSCPGGGGSGDVIAGAPQTPGQIVKWDAVSNQIIDSIMSESAGVITVSGALTVTGGISGDGSGLTNLEAGDITSGTLNDARLSANVALLNAANSFTGINTFSNAGNSFTGSGAGLTNLNASNVSSGTLAVSFGGTGTNSFTANGVLFGNATGAILATAAGSTGQCLIAGVGGVPGFQACPVGGDISSGTSQTPGTITKFDTTTNQITDSLLAEAAGTITASGNFTITGTPRLSALSTGILHTDINGNVSSSLVDLGAEVSGTLSDARLSANVALLNANQTFTGINTFSNAGNSFTGDGAGLSNVDAALLNGQAGSFYRDASNINAGSLGVGFGGTGQTTYTDGQLLIGNSVGNTLTKATLTAGSGVTIVNGNGSITISAPTAGSCGTCANVTLSNLSSPTAINQSLLTDGSATIDLGSAANAFRDLYLNSQVSILESGATPTFRGNLAVADLSANQTYTLNEGGNVVTSGNVGNYATTGVTAGSGLTGGGTTGVLTVDIGAGNGITVNPNDITLNLQANKGLEVDANGLSLIDCADTQILKYSTGTNTWSCAADAGGSGLGDNISVNGSAAADANFLDVAATGTVTGTAWSLNTVSNPDDITIAISNASATTAGSVTTGTQTFAGAKTFNNQITAGAGIDLGAQTLVGTTAVIDFTNFDVSSAGAVTAVGVNAGSGLLEGTGGLTVTGTANVNSTGGSATNLGTGTGNVSAGNATGTLTLTGSSSSSFVLNGTTVTASEFNILDGGIDLGTETAGNYVATITAGNGLTGDATGEGSTPTLAVASANGGIVVNADNIQLTLQASADALSSTTSTGSGLEVLTGGLTLLQGCSNGQILKWNETTDVWECSADGVGTTSNSFSTINAPAGTDPVATSASDTLNLVATGANLTITGDSGTDTLTFDIDESVLAGNGITASGDALQVNVTNGIQITSDAVEVNQNFGFAWTAQQSWTPTSVTQTGAVADFNLTLGNDADVDTVSAVNIDVTSAATGDADIVYGLNVGNLTGADATVLERAIRVGANWDEIFDINGTLISASEFNILDGGIDLGTETAGNYVATITAGNGLTGDATGEGSTPTLAVASANGGIVVNADNIALTLQPTSDALSATTSSGSGMEILAGGLTLLQGCANNNILKWNETTDVWACSTDDSGSGTTTLQNAYDNTADATPEIVLTAAQGTLTVRDAATPISGNLFEVQNNAGSTSYLSVDTSGIQVAGSIKLTGSTSFPGSPTEGQIYYRTDTDQLYVYTGSKWQADRTTATKIVAANDSQNKEKADYVADGTADQTEINAALSALPAAGGIVYLLEGTYTTDGEITMGTNKTLAGSGNSTLIQLASSVSTAINAINANNVNNVTLKDFRLDGNKAGITAGIQDGIELNNVGSGSGASAVTGGKIDKVTIQNFEGIGINIVGVNGANTVVSDSIVKANVGDGIVVSNENTIISNNHIQGNGDKGLYIQDQNVTVNDNLIESNTNTGIYSADRRPTISGNKLKSNGDGGLTEGNIIFVNSDYASVTGNTLESGNPNGMYVNSAIYATITANTIYNSVGDGATLGSDDVTFTANNLRSNGGDGIEVSGGDDRNNISSNNISASGASGINLNGTYHNLSGNTISSSVGRAIDIGVGSSNHSVNNNNLYNNATNGTSDQIYLDQGANNNQLVGNKISSTTGSGCAIKFVTVGTVPVNTYFADNTYSGTGSSQICTASSSTTYANQHTNNNDLVLQSRGAINIGQTTAGAGTLSVTGAYFSSQLSTPSTPTATRQGAAGAATYKYKVTALDGLGETAASTESTGITNGAATLNGTDFVRITFNQVGGATQYKVYRTTASGGSPATTGLIGTINAGTATTNSSGLIQFDDTGLAASTAAPVLNTTGGGLFAGDIAINGGDFTSTSTTFNFLQSTVTTLNIGDATNTINLAGGSGSTGCTIDGTNGNLTCSGTISGGTAITLQSAYDNTADATPEIVLTSSQGVLSIQDATVALGTNLLEVQSNGGGSTYFGVSASTISLNVDTTVAAGKALTVIGGNTASRPGSPTEGMLYYDQTIDRMLVYENSKWQADRSSSTKIVGMGAPAGCTGSVPVASQTYEKADYVVNSCTSAQTEINNAIAALPAGGGTVYLLDGTYIIDGAINVTSNITLTGSGAGTVIKLKDAINAAINAIAETTNPSRVTISNLRLDGNKANNSSGTQKGISIVSGGADSKIHHVWAENFRSTGVEIDSTNYASVTSSSLISNGTTGSDRGLHFVNSDYGVASNNVARSNTGDGIIFSGPVSGSDYGVISGNNVISNSGVGIQVGSGSYMSVTGNNVSANTGRGISATAPNSTISSNVVTANGSHGIEVSGTSINNVSITGNTVNANTDIGIRVATVSGSISNAVVSSNRVDNNGGNGDSSIYLQNTNSASIVNNNITDTAGTSAFAIEIVGGNANYLAGNTYSGTGATSISDGGTSTIYGGQQTDTNSSLLLQTAAAGSINVGSVGTSAIASTTNIANTSNATGAQVVTIGTSASNTGNVTTIQGGSSTTGAIVLTPNTAGAILIGASAGTGNITVGSSSATQSVLIGNGTGASTVNISNANTAGAVNVGSAFTTGTITLGGTTQTGTLTVGQSTASNTINIGNATIATGNTGTINIGTSATGTGKTVTTIGSTNDASSVTLQAGTGNINLNAGTISTNASVVSLLNSTATTVSFAGAATTLNIGPTGTSGSILFSGGSADTGCTIDGTNGNLTCSGTISGGTAITLQSAYDNTADATPEIVLTSSQGVLSIQDATVALGTNLLEVQSNGGGSTYFGVSASTISLNVDTVVAAGKALTVIGGNTASRPGSPTEGMLYYDQTIDRMLVYENSKWQADRSTATKIVGTSASGGASSAVASQNPDAADFVNTSDTSAQTVINSAIAALPANGGTVYLMDGTYIIDGSINLADNVTIAGVGAGTIIKNKTNGVSATYNAIDGANIEKVTIKDLRLDGNKAGQTGGTQYGIYTNFSGTATLPGVSVQNVHILNFRNWGISFNFSDNSSLDNVTVTGSAADGGVSIQGSRDRVNNSASLSNTGVGFSVDSDGATVDNNTATSNSSVGFYILGSTGASVTGNTVTSNGTGISLDNSSHITVSGNYVTSSTNEGIETGNALSSSSNVISDNVVRTSGTNGIRIDDSSDNNTVSGNRINGVGGSGSNAAIEVGNFADNNVITSNNVSDTSGTSCGINFLTTFVGNNNYIADNYFSVTATTPICNAPTTTVIGGQLDQNNDWVLQGSRTVINQDTELFGSLNSGYAGIGQFGNLLTYSEQLNQNAPWVPTTVTVNADDITAVDAAPDKQQTAEELLATAASSSLRQDSATAAGSTYTFSVWIKSNSTTTNRNVNLRINGSTTGTGTAKAIVATPAWQRFFVTQNTTGFTGNVRVVIELPTSADDIHAWGAQLIAGSSPGAYVRSTASTITTSSGVVSNGGLFVSSINSTDKPLIVQAAVGQTANLFEVQDTAGGLLAAIDSAGRMVLPTLGASTGAVAVCRNSSNQISSCGINSAGVTLQQAYDADADSADSTIALTGADGGLIVSNPSSGGIASGAALKIDQLSTGAIEGFRIESAGTGNLVTVRDTTATAKDVFKIADGGATTFQNQTDSTAAFRIQNAAASQTLLAADTSNNDIKFGANLIAQGAATATTATTSGTGTNTTTLTFSGTTSFANDDILYIDNAGQDYYTRIVSGGTAASVTVSPAVTFETGRTVTKYTVQNIGSATNTTPVSNDEKFFQGYFLGGIVAGAGSTHYADGSILFQGDTRLHRSAADTLQTGNLIVQPTSNGDALRVNNAGGFDILRVDTNTAEVITKRLYASGADNVNAMLEVSQAGTADIFQARDNGVIVFSIADGGKTTFKNSVDSTTAFQIQKSDATPLLTADTTNSSVSVRGTNSVAVLGGEKTTNGTFTGNATGWTLGTGWAYNSNNVTKTAGTASILQQSVSAVNGETYKVTFTISSWSAGCITPVVGGVNGNTICYTFVSPHTETQLITATGTGNLQLSADSTFNGTIDDVSVTRLTASSNVLAVQNSDGSTGVELRSGGIGLQNLFMGANAGQSNVTGNFNLAFGYQALQNNTSGSYNMALGYQSLGQNTTGEYNLALGANALFYNTTGSENIAIGRSALQINKNGNYNVGIGAYSLSFSTAGLQNTAVGYKALEDNTGNQNTALGYQSLSNNTSGFANTGFGSQALVSTTTGSQNVALGYQAGYTTVSGNANTTGSNNTYIGANAGPGTSTQYSNSTAIGTNAVVSQSNSLVLGCISGTNGCSTSTKIGIGTTTPGRTLSVSETAAPAAIFNRSNDGSLIEFASGGTVQGDISIAGATVSYNAFTGSHYAISSGPINSAEIVTNGGVAGYLNGANAGEPLYEVSQTTVANDPKVLGSYLQRRDSTKPVGVSNPDLIAAVGNGEVWLVDNGQNISAGTNLISSDVAGHAMADTGVYSVSHIFARVAESVDWRGVTTMINGRKHTKVSVFYGFFDKTNNVVQSQNIITESLQAQNVETGSLNVSGTATLANLVVTGTATIKALVVTGDATFRGDIKIDGHIVTGGKAPSIEALADAGTGATAVVEGTDTAGTIVVTTGSNPAIGELAKVIFNKVYGSAPRAVISPSNDAAGGLRYFKGDTTISDFILNIKDKPAPNTEYRFDYFIAE